MSLRTDNGSQFEASLFQEYLWEMSIDHEFTHVASPQENCYIESYHSILESAVCAKYELESLQEAAEVFNRFVNFYKQGRIHGSLNMLSPNQFLLQQQTAQPLRLFPMNEESTVTENLKE